MVIQGHLKKITTWGLLASLVVIFLGWSANIPEEDLAQYVQTHALRTYTYPIIYSQVDLLTSVFGNNNIAFRFPAFFFVLVTLYTLYRFALLVVNREVALLTILIFVTLQATFLINITASPEISLTAFYTAAIGQLSAYYKERRLVNLTEGIAAAFFAAISTSTFPEIAGSYDPFHMIADLGWGFFPWGLFMVLGMIDKVKELRKGQVPFIKQIGFYAFLVTLVILSINPYPSRFDVIILCPMGALITAEYIYKIFYTVNAEPAKSLFKVQIILSFVFIGLLFALVWFPFPEANYYGMIHFFALLSAFTWLIFFSSISNKLVIACTVLSIGTNLVLNTYFFPNLLTYQAGSELGKLASQGAGADLKLYSYRTEPSASLAFYAGVPVISDSTFKHLVSQKDCFVYTTQDMLDEFKAARPDLKVIASRPDFPIHAVNIDFFDPVKRRKITSSKILIKL